MRDAACALEDGVGHLLKARRHVAPDLLKYDSSHDAPNLLYVAIRHIEAIALLASQDVALGQAAVTLARAALEVSVRALWLVDDNDPFRRERRWLVLVEEEVRGRRRAQSYAQASRSKSVHDADPTADALEKFAKDVDAMLPAGYPRLTRVPTAEQMFGEVKLKLLD
jgi:hypothetical protein